MPKLVFRVASDWEEVVKLRNEIAKLKQELKGMDSTQSPAAFKTLNTHLAASTQRMDELVAGAAKAGAEMENGFKRKIFDASQSVNGFTEKIIAQKNAIGTLQTTIRKNKELYKTIVSRGGEDKELLNHIREQEKALGKERDALFKLTQQQAEARLSVKKLRDEYSLYKNEGKQVVETNNGIAISWKKALAVIGGVSVLKALGSELIRVRGEFQSMQTAMETMVGKDIAGLLMAQVKELAKISPLTMTDMVGAEKMMLGFNIQAEDTIKYLKALSDISMGESGKFNSLTLAFSQMSAAGKLMGQDFNQMINAGFNPLQTISEKTGKSIATLKDEMSKGAISAEMVQQAFLDATAAGGKFYNMSENASKTINGQISMMQDALDNVFNELGTKGEGAIMSGIQMTTSLIENYEIVGKVLAGLVITYGTYRTAVMLSTIATNEHTLAEIALTNVRVLARKAQLALNASMLTNPYVLLATAVVGLGAAMWAMSDSTTAAARAQKEYNDIKDAASKKEQEHKQKIEKLLTAARDESLATLTRQKSLEELRKEYPKIFGQYDIEKLKLEDILKLKQQINEEDSKRSVQGRKDSYDTLKAEIAKQQRYLSLIKNPTLQRNMSEEDKELLRINGGDKSYYRIKEELKKNSELLKKYQKDVLDDNIAAYKANLKNYSKEKLEAELKMAQSSASKRNGFNVGGMMVKGGNLESLISSINGALAEKKSTYKQDYDKAKKDWEDAKKALSEIEKDKDKFTSKQYDDAKKRKETAEKAYKDLGGITNTSKQEKQAAQIRTQNEKILQMESKQALDRRRQQEDLENQVSQSKINAMSNGYEKGKAQRELNNKKELQALKRQKEDYIRAYVQAQKDLFNAQEELKAKQNKGYVKKTFDASSVSVNTSSFDTIIGNTQNRQLDDQIRDQESAWNEYLSKYGTFLQKRQAITEEYQMKINEASTAGDAAIYQKQMEEALSSLDMNKLKQEINWEMVFGDLSKASKKSLDKVKKQLKEFKDSDEYQSMSLEDKKIIDESLNNIQTAIIDKGGLLGDLPNQLQELADAQRELNKAQEEYNEAMKNGTDQQKEAATKKKNAAEIKLQNAQTNVQTSADKTVSNLNSVAGAMQQLSGTDVSLSNIGNAVSSLVDVLGESKSKIGGIIAAILSILDTIGDKGITDFVTDLVSNVLSSLRDAAIKDIEKTSFGLLDMSFFKGADYSDYDDMVEEYNNLNEIWDELIDKKKEYIEMSYGAEAYKVGQEAEELVRKSIESYRTLGLERLNSGASTGSHSIGVRIRKGMSSEGWNEAKAALGNAFDENKIGDGRMTGLFNLSVEQLDKLKSEAPTFWAKLDDDVQDYLNKIIEGEKRVEDIQEAVREQLTATTFDNVYSSFLDTLMNMDASAKDFSDDFREYMFKAVLSNTIGDKFQEQLKGWYEQFADANKDGGISDSEMANLQAKYEAITNAALAERDAIAAAIGYNTSSSQEFESFVSQMQSSLLSLDATAKDVSDNIYDYFRQAMINALYDKEYKSKMEELYKNFETLSADGLSENDMAQLGSQVDQYIEQMMKGVESVNSLFADKLKDAEDMQSFVESVKSAMSSIEATAEDVTDNIFEYIRQQMVEKMFADTFQSQIEAFYQKVQAAMSDGDITDSERDALRSEAEKLANDIVAAKDILSDTLGITSNNLRKELEEEFKSFSDGILNSLYDAEVTSEAVAKNIADSMRRELIKAMYVEQYEPRIRAIWDKWKEYSSDGLVTDEERANIKNDIDEIGKEVADAAKEISDAWTDSGEEVKKAFDSFSNSIKSVLYDAEATAEDVANNIYQYMRNALVDSMFAAQLQPQIQAWYDKYTEFMKDGAIDSEERKTLDEMIAEIQKAGVEIIDASNSLFPSLDTGAIKRAEEAAQEMENARNEAEQEWESFSDDMLNSLYDVEAKAEDISDNMGEYMRKALIKAMYVENFKPQMKKWYDEWQRAMGDGELTSEEKQLLDSMKQTMVDDMKKEVDAINQMFDSMYSQQASSKGFEAMSQDTGEELNGRFTALQTAGEEIKNQAVKQTVLLSSINDKMSLLDLTSQNLPLLTATASPGIAERTKEVLASSYQPQMTVIFPDAKIDALTTEVSNLRGIVDEMRTFQVEGNLDRKDIVENSAILAKNSPKVLDNTNEIKRDIKNAI